MAYEDERESEVKVGQTSSVLDESLSGAEEKGWESRKIEDVCEVISGQSPNGRYYNQEANGTPFYQGKKEFTNRFLGEPTKWTTFVTKEAVAGDIVMSVRAPVGPVNEVSERICIGRGLAAIRSGDKIEKDFLWYFLLNIQNDIEGKDGAVFPSISRREIESIELMLPPLEEQQRIVEILDESFAELETARSNVAANLESSKELFQSVLDESLNGAEEKGWKIKNLGDCFKTVTGNTPPKKDKTLYGEYLPFVKPPELLGGVICGTSDGLSEAGSKVARVASPGAILVACIGILGKCGLVDSPVAFNQQINGIMPNHNVAISKYVFYLVQSSLFINQLHQRAKGTTVTILKKSSFNQVLIPLPLLKEQQCIVEKLDSLSEKTDSLQQQYTSQLADIDELRQSLLQKAFAGELT